MALFDRPTLKQRNGNIIPVNANPFKIGRGLICNYVIPNTAISRQHCYLEKREGKWYLRDTSTNGCYLNGVLVKKECKLLSNNDEIGLCEDGSYDFTFQYPDCYLDGDISISDEQLNLVADSIDTVLSEVPLTTVPISETSTDVGAVPKRPRIEQEPQTDIATTSCSTINVPPICDAVVPSQESTSTSELPKNLPQAAQDRLQPSGSGLQTELKNDQQFEEMGDEMMCSICSEMFVKAVTLNCSHTFCKYCIDTWKRQKSVCPICRAHITTMNATLVLDNMIGKVVQSLPEDAQKHRKEMIEERERLTRLAEAPHVQSSYRGRGRGRGRGRAVGRGRNRQGSGATGTAQTDGDPAAPAEAPAGHDAAEGRQLDSGSANSISITLSDSESSRSDSSFLSDDDDTDLYYGDSYFSEDDLFDFIFQDSPPRPYFGGYGRCFVCGRPDHWANGCPYR